MERSIIGKLSGYCPNCGQRFCTCMFGRDATYPYRQGGIVRLPLEITNAYTDIGHIQYEWLHRHYELSTKYPSPELMWIYMQQGRCLNGQLRTYASQEWKEEQVQAAHSTQLPKALTSGDSYHG